MDPHQYKSEQRQLDQQVAPARVRSGATSDATLDHGHPGVEGTGGATGTGAEP